MSTNAKIATTKKQTTGHLEKFADKRSNDVRNMARIAGIDGKHVLDGIRKMGKNTHRRITMGL